MNFVYSLYCLYYWSIANSQHVPSSNWLTLLSRFDFSCHFLIQPTHCNIWSRIWLLGAHRVQFCYVCALSIINFANINAYWSRSSIIGCPAILSKPRLQLRTQLAGFINPWRAALFKEILDMFAVTYISQFRDVAGSWNPPSWNTKTGLSYKINIIARWNKEPRHLHLWWGWPSSPWIFLPRQGRVNSPWPGDTVLR